MWSRLIRRATCVRKMAYCQAVASATLYCGGVSRGESGGEIGLESGIRCDKCEEMNRKEHRMHNASAVLAACLKRPGHGSVWSVKKGRYVCKKDPEYAEAVRTQTIEVREEHPPISSTYSLVLWGVLGGTLFFTILCVGVRLYLREGVEPGMGMDELLKTLEKMAFIGFGALIGMLGGHSSRPKIR